MFSFWRNALKKQALYFRGKKGGKENMNNTVWFEIMILEKNKTGKWDVFASYVLQRVP